MTKITKFEDLTIFQMARDLTKEVYAITKNGEFNNVDFRRDSTMLMRAWHCSRCSGSSQRYKVRAADTCCSGLYYG